MDIETYKTKLSELKISHKLEEHKLVVEYVSSHLLIKNGDTVKCKSGGVFVVDSIKISRNHLGDPCASFSGLMLTKNMKYRKDLQRMHRIDSELTVIENKSP